MALIGPGDKAQIRSAIQDLTDTFFVTPVKYERLQANMDRLNTGTANKNYDTYNLNGLVEYDDQDTDRVMAALEGKKNKQRVKVTFNFNDLKTADVEGGGTEDLTTTDKFVKLKAETDFMTVHGNRYEVEFVGLDGPLDNENLLVIVKGIIEESKT